MPAFEWNQLLGPLGGIIALTLMSGMAMGWRFRVSQDKLNMEHMTKMLQMMEKKLKDSDEVCQMRVDQVREDIESITKRHDRELSSIRASHRDEVDTLKNILDMLVKRVEEISGR